MYYTELAEIPVPTGAQFVTPHDDTYAVVQITYSVRDHAKNIKRAMVKSIVLPTESNPAVPTLLQDTDTIAQVISPSGEKRAVWRKSASGGDTISKRFVEVWNDGVLEYSWNVNDHHGDFYADEFFGSFYFSPSEKAVMYVAEGKAEETKDPFEKFRFNPDFGEGLVGKRRPVIFLLQCWRLLRFGQPVFSPQSDDIIYATGYEFTVDGRILGIKGCFNRPSGIWQLRFSTSEQNSDGPITRIFADCLKFTPSHLSCRSPRSLNHQGRSTLFWLSCKSSGAHLATSTVHSLDISSETDLGSTSPPQNTLIDVIEAPDANGFPGLYPDYNLPYEPFFAVQGSSPSIFISSFWASRKTVIQASTDTGAVKDLTPDNDDNTYSWSFLTTDGRSRIICSRSSPSVPYEILLGTFSSSGLVWKSLDKPSLSKSVETALSSVRTSIIRVPAHGLVETIVIQNSPKENSKSKAPCITSPHGGPHGSASTAFAPMNTALVLEGYTLSLPNYTGSPGYGDKFLQELIGRCGDLDVEDTIASARHLIDLGISEEGPAKQFITGGSHGGFLTAHLIGRYPSFFSAAALQNPVISVGEVSSTDIPDWYFSEFGISYPMTSLPPYGSTSIGDIKDAPAPPLVTVDIFTKLQAASPISRVDAINIPVLLLIGAADRRVAPSHGIEFYHALKARYAQGAREPNRRVDILVFEGESHPLEGVEASKASFEATVEWFARARNSDSQAA